MQRRGCRPTRHDQAYCTPPILRIERKGNRGDHHHNHTFRFDINGVQKRAIPLALTPTSFSSLPLFSTFLLLDSLLFQVSVPLLFAHRLFQNQDAFLAEKHESEHNVLYKKSSFLLSFSPLLLLSGKSEWYFSREKRGYCVQRMREKTNAYEKIGTSTLYARSSGRGDGLGVIARNQPPTGAQKSSPCSAFVS